MKFLPQFFILFALSQTAQAAFVVTQVPQNIRDFLGGSGCTLAWSAADSAGNYVLRFADITGGGVASTICKGAFPRLSPGATHLLYVDLSGAICIRTCIDGSPDSDRLFITAAGRSPNWWVRPSDTVAFVTYTSGSGGLWCQKLDKGYRPDGPPTLLYEAPAGEFFTYTGRSADGRFFATREEGAAVFAVSPGYAVEAPVAWTFVSYTGNGTDVVEGYCHGDMSPAGSAQWASYGSAIHFYMGMHEAFYIRRYSTDGLTARSTPFGIYGYIDSGHVAARIAAPPLWEDSTYTAWEEIRWTSNPDYIAATALRSTYGRSDLFFVKAADSTMLRIGTGMGIGYAVWVDSTGGNDVASLPIASVLRGRAPLTIAFDGTHSKGGGISYLWRFGDGTSSTVAAPTHVYTQAGSYRVWLTVQNGTESDSSYIPIIVDSVAPPARSLLIYPGPAATVDRGKKIVFSVRAVDSAGGELPSYNALWQVRGSSGATIQTDGSYAAGMVSGFDTVEVTLDSLKAACIVRVAAATALAVLEPAAGASYTAGDTLGMVIGTDASRVRKVVLYFSNDGGRSLALINTSAALVPDGDSLRYSWTIPKILGDIATASDSAMIIAADYNGIEPSALSGFFSVKGDNRVITVSSEKKALIPLVRQANGALVLSVGVRDRIMVVDPRGRIRFDIRNESNHVLQKQLTVPAAGLWFVVVRTGQAKRVFSVSLE